MQKPNVFAVMTMNKYITQPSNTKKALLIFSCHSNVALISAKAKPNYTEERIQIQSSFWMNKTKQLQINWIFPYKKANKHIERCANNQQSSLTPHHLTNTMCEQIVVVFSKSLFWTTFSENIDSFFCKYWNKW